MTQQVTGALECYKQYDGPVTATAKDMEKFTESVIYRNWDYSWGYFFWRGQRHLTSDWNTKLDERLSNLRQGTFITSDKV